MPVTGLSTKTNTFTNGNANDASQVETEFTNLFGNDTTVKTFVDSLLNGNIQDGTALTILSGLASSPTSDLKVIMNRGSATDVHPLIWDETNDLLKRSNDAGSTVISIPQALSADPGTLSNLGAAGIFFNTTSDIWKFYDGTNLIELNQKGLSTDPLDDLFYGPVPQWIDASTIRIPQGFKFMDSSNTNQYEFAADVDVDITASAGAGALDTGTEAAAMYYLYALGDSTGSNDPTAVLSATDESTSGTITLPAGWDVKRQLPIGIRNSATGQDILPFQVTPMHQAWKICFTQVNYASSDYDDLVGGSSSSYATVNFKNVPSFARMADIDFELRYSSTLSYAHIRPSSAGGARRLMRTNSSNNTVHCHIADFPVGSGSFQYVLDGGTGANLDVTTVAYVVRFEDIL